MKEMLEIIHQILEKENQKNAVQDTADIYKSDRINTNTSKRALRQSILRTTAPHLSSKHIESTLLTELQQILKTIKSLKKNHIWKKKHMISNKINK